MHWSQVLTPTDQVWSECAAPLQGAGREGVGARRWVVNTGRLLFTCTSGVLGSAGVSRSGAGGGCQALQLRVQSSDHPLQGLATLPREQHWGAPGAVPTSEPVRRRQPLFRSHNAYLLQVLPEGISGHEAPPCGGYLLNTSATVVMTGIHCDVMLYN